MKFDNIPPKWDAQGTEPSADLQTNGFTAGYKPPAAYFNYLFNKITACLKELQTKLSSTATTAATTAANSIKSVGEAIPDNTDLNTYITDGVYYSAGATVSATLGNAPYSTCGFRLMVVPTITGNGFKKQIVLPSGRNSIAVRSYYNNEWEDWFYVESVGRVDELLTTDKSSVVAAVNELVSNTCSLAGGTKLTEGVDLNEFKTVGNYYCHQNSIAATLKNCPTNSAFTLKVGLAAGSIYPSQEITLYNTGVRYYRWFNTETSAWSEYRVFAPTGDLAALTTTNKGNVVAAINEINSLVKWLDANALKSLGTDIPESADLDTYTTNGVYRSSNAARSQTLNSAPYTGSGFRLIVYPTIGGSTYIKQLAIPSATDQFAMRTLLTDGWTEWVFINGCIDKLTSTSTTAPLSAKQGKVLNDKINDVANGVDYAATTGGGNYMTVKSDGSIGQQLYASTNEPDLNTVVRAHDNVLKELNNNSEKSSYKCPLYFKAHGSVAVAFAHIPQNKTNVKISQCVNYGVSDYVNNCTITYDATGGFVVVTCTNTTIIDKLAYGTFTWD